MNLNSKTLNELLRAFKSKDYSKLEEAKSMVSDEDYKKAVNLFNQYSDKPEDEILDELSKLKHTVPNHKEMVEKIKPFLDKEQLSRLDKVMEYLDKQD